MTVMIEVTQPNSLNRSDPAQTSAADLVLLRKLEEQGENVIVLVEHQSEGFEPVLFKQEFR